MVFAQESTTPDHRIEFIKELVLDVQDAEWSDQTGERLSLISIPELSAAPLERIYYTRIPPRGHATPG